MSKNQGRKPTGRVNYVWVAAALYLLYVTYQLLSSLWKGEAETPAMNIIGGLLFLAGAVLLLLREWQAYQYGLAHKDDPETWSDESAEDEAAALEEVPEAADDGEEKEEDRP